MGTDTAIAAALEDPRRFLRRREAGAYLKENFGFWSASTLAKIACESSDGPPFRKCGRAVFYELGDLRRWALARLGEPRRSTSESAATKRLIATSESVGV